MSLTPVECPHDCVIRGRDVPRNHGSFRTQVCLDCKHFRRTDHFDKPTGDWYPIKFYPMAVDGHDDQQDV